MIALIGFNSHRALMNQFAEMHSGDISVGLMLFWGINTDQADFVLSVFGIKYGNGIAICD